MSEDNRIVLFGAYATGTNFVRRTLTDSGLTISNYPPPEELNRGAKHCFKHYVIESDILDVLRPSGTTLFICLVKDPFHWMKSLHAMVQAGIMPAREMRRLRSVVLGEFVRAPGTMVGARRVCSSDEQARVRYSSLPDFWNRYVRGYREYLPPDRTMILRYEDVLFRPYESFGRVMERAGSPVATIRLWKQRRFQNVTSPGVGRNYDEAIRYYSDPDERHEWVRSRRSGFHKRGAGQRSHPAIRI